MTSESEATFNQGKETIWGLHEKCAQQAERIAYLEKQAILDNEEAMELTARIKVLESLAWDVVSHPAFSEGTNSNAELPQGLWARIRDLKAALSGEGGGV